MEKIIDIEERIPTLREKRKKRSNRKFFILLLFLILIVLTILYFQSPLSHIQKLEVSGNQLMDKDFYLNQSTLHMDDSMWGWSTKKIEKQFQEIEWVKKVDVNRQLWSSVSIQIEEYPKAAVMETDSHHYFVLENGTLFKEEEAKGPYELPLLHEVRSQSVRQSFIEQLQSIDEPVKKLMSEVLIQEKVEPTRLTIFMSDGNEVKAILSTLAEKMNYYPYIVTELPAQNKGVIDLEVGSFFESFNDVYGPEGEKKDEGTEEQPTETDSQ